LIWLKRIAPFVIIAAAVYAYFHYTGEQAAEQAALEKEYALVTAKIWVATATFRSEPEAFAEYRDSILAASSLTEEDILTLVKVNSEAPEGLYPFTRMVQELVDSLLEVEDSLAGVRQDSITTAARVTR
jgi:hypothetical protein